MFIILVGLFSPMREVRAAGPDDIGTCTLVWDDGRQDTIQEGVRRGGCVDIPGGLGVGAKANFEAYSDTHTDPRSDKTKVEVLKGEGSKPKGDGTFKGEVDTACAGWWNWSVGGCLAKLIYYTLFQLPSWILWLSAQFFDVMIDLGIKSSVTSASGFIPEAWAVVRDISNIFFILILLYIAIQTILGLGGHEVKQMIAKVIVIALLINFSMFFTKVVIDSSNILALIFYNKIDVKTTRSDGGKIPKDDALQEGKNISGAMWKTFDATRLINKDTIALLKKTEIEEGKFSHSETLPWSLMIGIMVVAGAIMLWAAYAFFVAGAMFIGRLIELWILIIFSPFAFMSSTVHKFSSIEYLGWDDWFKRLISTSFMAPIFMFFMYLIFMLLPHIYNTKTGGELGELSEVFSRGGTTTLLGSILSILIPTLIIMAMLLKATEFAKKGGGQFGALALTVSKIAVGVAAAVASGGTALAGRALIGGVGGSIAKVTAKGADKFGMNKTANRLRNVGALAKTSSFDLRATNWSKKLASAGGIPVGGPIYSIEEKKNKREEKRVEKEKQRAKRLEVGENDKISRDIRQSEADLKLAMNSLVADFHHIDEELKDFRQFKQDATTEAAKQGWTDKINELIEAKKALERGETVTFSPKVMHGQTIYGEKAKVGGKSIKELKDRVEKQTIEKEAETTRRRVAFAESIGSWWRPWRSRDEKQARYEIIMGTKIKEPSHDKESGHSAPRPKISIPTLTGGGGGNNAGGHGGSGGGHAGGAAAHGVGHHP